MNQDICRFSIDVEAGGDNPHERALLEIGICVVGDESKGKEVLFKPDLLPFDRHALKAIRRPIEEFINNGTDLVIGINNILDWIDEVASGRKVEFLGLNMPYDWMFFKTSVAKANAKNTLPHKSYNILSYGAGVFRLELSKTNASRLVELISHKSPHLISKYSLTKKEDRRHTALDDAKYQSRLLCALEECRLGIDPNS